MSTFGRVRRLLADIKKAEEQTITPQTSLRSLNVDSLDLTKFIMAWEEQEGGIELSDSEAEQSMASLYGTSTVQDLVDWIERNELD